MSYPPYLRHLLVCAETSLGRGWANQQYCCWHYRKVKSTVKELTALNSAICCRRITGCAAFGRRSRREARNCRVLQWVWRIHHRRQTAQERSAGQWHVHVTLIGTRSHRARCFKRIQQAQLPQRLSTSASMCRSRSFKATASGTNRNLVYDFLLVNYLTFLTYILSCTVSKLLHIIGQILLSPRWYLSLAQSFGVNL